MCKFIRKSTEYLINVINSTLNRSMFSFGLGRHLLCTQMYDREDKVLMEINQIH